MNLNIIPKTDNSRVRVANTSATVSKVERYGWNKDVGKPGEYLMLNKMDLDISGDYQRHGNGKVDIDGVMSGTDKRKKSIKQIAKSFSWELFGVLIVVMWKDGTLWVVDGGHRTIAARLRDDITMLPALVFERPDIDREELLKMDANLFFNSCKMRRSMDSYDRHRAATIAEHDDALAVNDLLMKFNIKLDQSARKPDQFSAVNTLKKCINRNPKTAEKALEVALSVAKTGPVTMDILSGIFYLLEKCGMTDKHIKVLKVLDDSTLNGSIKNTKALLEKGGERVCAVGIAKAINAIKGSKVPKLEVETI